MSLSEKEEFNVKYSRLRKKITIKVYGISFVYTTFATF